MRMIETKKCTKCGEVKALGEFQKRKGYNALRSWCRACIRIANANWRANNPEKVKARYRRKYKNQAEKLTDQYVRKHLLGMPAGYIPPELIEAKRQQILTHRAIKQLQSTLKEKDKP